MRNRRMLAILVVVLSLMVCSAKVAKAEPMGTAFTYQGFLMDAKGKKPKPANGLYDFMFELYDDPNVIDGNQVGSTIDINDLDITDGHFTVELDFGSGIFTGDARWLETEVREGDSSDPNDFVILSPRIELTPFPYSQHTRGIFVDDVGNVGIGTTNPGATLDVSGTINATTYTGGNVSNWDMAFGWGDHSTAGYLTSYMEIDPIFIASAASGISSTNITNWNTSYGWGNHALEVI